MKKTMLFFYLLLIISCNKKATFYHGVVIDANKKPIANVNVSLRFDSNKSTFSKENGYFKLSKSPDIIDDLVFSKKGYITDTIFSVWTQHGEKVNYTFLNKSSDTIRLKRKVQ